jgi:hypothetical protein
MPYKLDNHFPRRGLENESAEGKWLLCTFCMSITYNEIRENDLLKGTNMKDKKKRVIFLIIIIAVVLLIILALSFRTHSVSCPPASESTASAVAKSTSAAKASSFSKPSGTAEASSTTTTSEPTGSSTNENNTFNSSSGTSANSDNIASNTSANNTGSNSSSSNSGGSATSNNGKSSTQTCRTVHHNATGHYENVTSQQWVQDTAAYDETVVDQAAYNDPGYYKCVCGYTTSDINDIYDHCEQDMGTFFHVAGTYHPAVTHTIHHDATGHYETVVTGQQWVQDSTAYDETVCD